MLSGLGPAYAAPAKRQPRRPATAPFWTRVTAADLAAALADAGPRARPGAPRAPRAGLSPCSKTRTCPGQQPGCSPASPLYAKTDAELEPRFARNPRSRSRRRRRRGGPRSSFSKACRSTLAPRRRPAAAAATSPRCHAAPAGSSRGRRRLRLRLRDPGSSSSNASPKYPGAGSGRKPSASAKRRARTSAEEMAAWQPCAPASLNRPSSSVARRVQDRRAAPRAARARAGAPRRSRRPAPRRPTAADRVDPVRRGPRRSSSRAVSGADRDTGPARPVETLAECGRKNRSYPM